jgi:hypothetical protein
MKDGIEAVLHHYGADMVPSSQRFKKMKCPFHEDRNASASVSIDAGKFRCFSCDIPRMTGETGKAVDALDIIAWKEGLTDFASTVAEYERISGRSYDEVSGGSKGKPARRRVFEGQAGPVRGQRTILSAGRRRRPFAGT